MRHSFEARCRLVQLMLSGVRPAEAAVVCGASRATAYRLLARYRDGGWAALRDRPPNAQSCPHRLSAEAETQIVALRRRTGWGPRRLSGALGWPPSTIWRVLRRHRCARRAVDARPDVVRYERERAGELVHLDIKKLGRFWQPGKRVLGDGINHSRRAGWQYLHLAVDDHSRLAHAVVLEAQTGQACAQALRAHLAFFSTHGVQVERLLTDNGGGYCSERFTAAVQAHGLQHRRTRPRRPQTNGCDAGSAPSGALVRLVAAC
jgi:transposase InsO family protein